MEKLTSFSWHPKISHNPINKFIFILQGPLSYGEIENFHYYYIFPLFRPKKFIIIPLWQIKLIILMHPHLLQIQIFEVISTKSNICYISLNAKWNSKVG
jgi:hypothetical protein